MGELDLSPWMLRADWREDRRPLAIVDLGTWPAEIALDPLPPVPVVAIGPADHPQAARADVLMEPPFTLDGLIARVTATPRTAEALVRLLRAIEGLPPERALPLESATFAMLQAGAEHAAWLTPLAPESPSPPGILHVARQNDRLDLMIDRPWARNAIDRDLRDALRDAFDLAALDPGIAHVRIRAAGRAFSLGADLAEFGTTRDPAEAHHIRARTLPAYAMIRRRAIYEVHVQGGCVGSGLEMAAFAGRVTATRSAWFQLPEMAMGILPGFGGCVSIPARIGRQRAGLLMLSGRRIGAAAALGWGLIDAIVDEPAVDDRGADMIG